MMLLGSRAVERLNWLITVCLIFSLHKLSDDYIIIQHFRGNKMNTKRKQVLPLVSTS